MLHKLLIAGGLALVAWMSTWDWTRYPTEQVEFSSKCDQVVLQHTLSSRASWSDGMDARMDRGGELNIYRHYVSTNQYGAPVSYIYKCTRDPKTQRIKFLNVIGKDGSDEQLIG